MLKKLSCIVLTSVISLFQTVESMAPVAAARSEKSPTIKTVSFQRVLTQLEKSKDVEKEIVGERKKWEDKIKKVETDIKAKVAALEAKAKTARPDALEKDKEEIEKLQREGKNIVQEADATLQKKFNKVMADLQKEIRDKIVASSRKNGWDLVIAEEAGILYAADNMRVDEIIINEMNAEYAKEKLTKKPVTTPVK